MQGDVVKMKKPNGNLRLDVLRLINVWAIADFY